MKLRRIGLLATSLTLFASPALAANTQTVHDAPVLTRASNGYWVDYDEFTFQSVASQEALAPYTSNHAWDGISDWSWDWSTGATKHHGDRDWNFSELETAFGDFGWKKGDSRYKVAGGLATTSAPQTARSLGQAYRFLKLAEAMEQGGIASIPDSLVFSIQADDGVGFDYSTKTYKAVDPASHLSIIPNINSEYFQGNTSQGSWTSVRRFTIKDLTPALARQLAKDLYSIASRCGSPIALDLDHDGQISVTGNSSAKYRAMKNSFVAEGSVLFDLESGGRKARYEWLKGVGDGFLVNDREAQVTLAINNGGEVDGSVLFGSAGGYENGFYKLAKMFIPDLRVASLTGVPRTDGVLRGNALKGLKVWIDVNHDAHVQAGEIYGLGAFGITEVDTKFRYTRAKDGEMLMRSSFVQNGKRQVTEDVWFAINPADQAR